MPDELVERLTGVLAREADALEVLWHRAAVLALLLHAGEGRFLSRAADEVDLAADDVDAIESDRISLSGDVARRLGLSYDANLQQLVDASGSERLAFLQKRLRAAADGIQREVDAGRRRAAVGLQGVRGALERLATGREGQGYGVGPVPDVPPSAFDERA